MVWAIGRASWSHNSTVQHQEVAQVPVTRARELRIEAPSRDYRRGRYGCSAGDAWRGPVPRWEMDHHEDREPAVSRPRERLLSGNPIPGCRPYYIQSNKILGVLFGVRVNQYHGLGRQSGLRTVHGLGNRRRHRPRAPDSDGVSWARPRQTEPNEQRASVARGTADG